MPPPTVHIHLKLYSDLDAIPSLVTASEPGEMATPEEARKFELWLRGIWGEKEERLKQHGVDHCFSGEKEVVLVRQM